MNATYNTTTDIDTNNNPWVESGAMVYVAITVATMSAVIMCCTWFITHNTALQRWLGSTTQYNGVDEEEEIELIEEPGEPHGKDEESYTDDNAFTLEGSSSDSDNSNEQVDAV